MKSNSINKQEIEKFSKIATEWWSPNGKFKPLHKFNPIRIQYLKENIIEHFRLKHSSRPLKKINILDIGCGGGLLSEPMSRLGANVTAIDASKKNIEVAKFHAKKSNLKINYLCSSPEKLNLLLSNLSGTIKSLGEELGIRQLSLATMASGDGSQVALSGYILKNLQLSYGVDVNDQLPEWKLNYFINQYFYLSFISNLYNSIELVHSFSFD